MLLSPLLSHNEHTHPPSRVGVCVCVRHEGSAAIMVWSGNGKGEYEGDEGRGEMRLLVPQRREMLLHQQVECFDGSVFGRVALALARVDA